MSPGLDVPTTFVREKSLDLTRSWTQRSATARCRFPQTTSTADPNSCRRVCLHIDVEGNPEILCNASGAHSLGGTFADTPKLCLPRTQSHRRLCRAPMEKEMGPTDQAPSGGAPPGPVAPRKVRVYIGTHDIRVLACALCKVECPYKARMMHEIPCEALEFLNRVSGWPRKNRGTTLWC